MDVIILAGGKGTRLKSVVAPYQKPLTLVSGRPLIQHALIAAAEAQPTTTVIVCAPQNVSQIVEVTRAWWVEPGNELGVRFIVQPDPLGPGAALVLGAELTTSAQVMCLMGDNTFGKGDVERVADCPDHIVIGITLEKSWTVAQHFTRISPAFATHEGIRDDSSPTYDRWEDGSYRCWLGPLSVSQDFIDVLRDKLPRAREEAPLMIGPHLSYAANNVRLVEVTCSDVGTPEAL